MNALQNFYESNKVCKTIPALYGAVSEQLKSAGTKVLSAVQYIVDTEAATVPADVQSKLTTFIEETGDTVVVDVQALHDNFKNDVSTMVVQKVTSGNATTDIQMDVELLIKNIQEGYLSAMGQAEVYSELGLKALSDTVNITDMLSHLKAALNTDYLPASVRSLLSLVKGQTVEDASMVVAKVNTFSDNAIRDWDFSHYGADSGSIAMAVLEQMFDDVTAGLQKVWSKINSLKSLFSAILDAGKLVVTGVAGLVFGQLLVDYECRQGNVPGFDLPFASFKLTAQSPIDIGISNVKYGKWNVKGGVVDTRLAMWQPCAFDYAAAVQSNTISIYDMVSSLTKATGGCEFMVGPILVRVVSHSNGEFKIGLFKTDYFLQGVYSNSVPHMYRKGMRAGSNQSYYANFFDEDWYNQLESFPIFDDGLNFGGNLFNILFKPSSTGESAYDLLNRLRFKDQSLNSGIVYNGLTSEQSRAIERLIFILLCYVAHPELFGKKDVMKGYRYNIGTPDAPIYYGTTDATADATNTVLFVPYNTVSTFSLTYHIQTSDEITAEWKTAIIGLIAAATVASITAKVFKLKRKASLNADLASTVYKEALKRGDLIAASKAKKKLRWANRLNKLVNGISPSSIAGSEDLLSLSDQTTGLGSNIDKIITLIGAPE